jgi:NADPH-dependent glutamate synthase beta subunit-like oxidoreductase
MSEIQEKANYCLSCPKPRCESGCPTTNHIRDFIRDIKLDHLADAAHTLYSVNPFPEFTSRLCDTARQCRGNCVRGLRGEPVHINFIERYISDHVKRDDDVKESNGRKIAIVGAGISSLACARSLALDGYRVEIFEKEEKIGGAIYTGIPAYRFDKVHLENLYKEMLSIGVIFHFGVTVGKDVTIDNLLFRFDRVLVAIGAQVENTFGLEAEEGCVAGLSLLYDLNVLGKRAEYKKKYKKAVVWGGGNVAMDCARSLIRIMDDVSIIYRRGLKEMPAAVDEIESAQKEGVKILFLNNIKELEKDEKGKVTGVKAVKMELGEPDESGRASFHEVENSEYELDVDLVVPAIGQKVDLEFIKPGLAKGSDGHKLNQDRLYFSGDCFLGPKTVAHCIKDGKDVALEIMSSFSA